MLNTRLSVGLIGFAERVCGGQQGGGIENEGTRKRHAYASKEAPSISTSHYGTAARCWLWCIWIFASVNLIGEPDQSNVTAKIEKVNRVEGKSLLGPRVMVP